MVEGELCGGVGKFEDWERAWGDVKKERAKMKILFYLFSLIHELAHTITLPEKHQVQV